MFKVNNRNTRTRREICSKLTIKTPERRSGVFIVNLEHITGLTFFPSYPKLTCSTANTGGGSFPQSGK